MFYLVTYFQFGLMGLCAVLTPLVIATQKNSYKLFGFLLFELHLAQLFMYEPGLDVSPYAFVHKGLYPVNIAGLSLAAVTSCVIIWFVVVDLLMKDHKISRSLFVLMLLALVPNLLALFLSDNILNAASDFLKLLTPFMVMIYIHKSISKDNIDWFVKLVTWINVLTVGQVFICKLVYGSFSAHNYYYEIAEETFGYYNHPHAFTGLLAFLAIWNIYRVNQKQQVKLNLLLFVSSLLLMFFSGTRTYVVALAAGLAYVGIKGLFSASTKNIRKYIYLAMCVAIVLAPYILTMFGASRITNDISSGRFNRWTQDIRYIFDESVDVILFGGGLGYIEEVNLFVEGWRINSLNLVVDSLANYGVIGLILMMYSYWKMLYYYVNKHTRVFINGMITIFIVASMINSITIYVAIMTQLVVMLRVIYVASEEVKL